MQLNPLGRTFFSGVKKYCYLDNYVPLRGRGDAEGDGALSQKKLMLSIELTGDAVGMPGWIGDAMAYVAKDSHGAGRVTFNKSRTMPGMTMEVYATADTKERALLLTACEFAKFSLEREGLEEKTRIWLQFQVRCADPLQLHNWLHGHFHQQFAVAFSQGQDTMDFDAPLNVKTKGDDPEPDNQAKLPGYEGENANTMDASRDAELKTAGTRKVRAAAAAN